MNVNRPVPMFPASVVSTFKLLILYPMPFRTPLNGLLTKLPYSPASRPIGVLLPASISPDSKYFPFIFVIWLKSVTSSAPCAEAPFNLAVCASVRVISPSAVPPPITTSVAVTLVTLSSISVFCRTTSPAFSTRESADCTLTSATDISLPEVTAPVILAVSPVRKAAVFTVSRGAVEAVSEPTLITAPLPKTMPLGLTRKIFPAPCKVP